ncbi:uncharacterized protein LOC135094854 [Scylla paramamosain]|uniref:uncharacterized protein LOC135094854 n=1 Tax=Scylla paramamosain TaxID=85552 RepID=UPI003082EDCC
MFLETLDGEVGDWRIYKEALPRDAMLILSTCKSATSLPTPLYDLQNGGLEVIGETSTYNTSLEELCDEEPKDFFLFFPFWMTYKEAKLWCGKLKGSVILPKDSETNALLVDRFIAYRDTCAQIWTHLFWVEAEGDAEEDTWRNAEGELLSFAPFLQEYEAGQEEVLCAAAVSHNRYKWAASPCQMETCVLCTFNTHPEIRLYGLCDHSSLDRLFSFREHPNFELVFEGASHVVLAAQNGSWMMRSRLYPSLKAVMVAQYEGQDPVGVRTWEVEGDRCREKEVQLLLTSCGHEEYTCDDGSCVARTDRCDQRVQCPDQSDEKGCSVVLLPPGYSPSLPPPPVSASALPIALSLAVTSVREFDLSSFTISMDASLKLLWRDQRLRYSNLVGDYRINKLKGSTQVWLPSLELTDGTRSTVAAEEHSTATYVIRRSGSLPDDDATLRRDVMYSGKHNPLYLCQDLTLTFKCHFHLQMYPFDLQECHIVLSLHDVTDHVGVLVQDQGVVFEGARHLLEYTLLHEELEVYSEANLSHARITFMFHNQFSYYIANTFLPTFIQVLIGLATLKFDVADFQDRIMVSLTSLLVLATFFTQTSQSIPKTSYLKLIDVWFVTVIFLDFAMIISIVYVEILRLRIKHPIGGFFAKVAPVSEPQSGCFASCKKAGGSEARRDTFSLSSSKHEEVNFWLFKLFAWAVGGTVATFMCVCMYGVLDEH